MLQKFNKINRVVVLLTLSDVLVWGTYLIAYPLQGIYMTYRYGDKSIEYISVGLFIYYILRAIIPTPVGYYVDKSKKDIDEIISLGVGSGMIGLSFIIFPFTTSPYEYFILMGLAGVGAALNLIGWRKLFAKNLDKNREGREYAAYETIMSLSTAIFSLVGGQFSSINHELFRLFFLITGLLTTFGGIGVAIMLLRIKRKSAIQSERV
jgi:MFS family permease